MVRKPVTPAEIAAAIKNMPADSYHSRWPKCRNMTYEKKVAEFVEGDIVLRYLMSELRTTKPNARKWLLAASDAGEVIILMSRASGQVFYRYKLIDEAERIEGGPTHEWGDVPRERLILNRFGHIITQDEVTETRKPADNSEWVITADEYEEILQDLKTREEEEAAKKEAEIKAKHEKLQELHGASIDKIQTHLNELGYNPKNMTIETSVNRHGKAVMIVMLYDDQIDAFANSLPDKE